MSELKYWLWLSAVTGVRPRVKTLLLDRYGGPREVYFAPLGAYKELGGIKDAECAALEDKGLDEALRIMDLCADRGITAVTLRDASFPERLRAVFDPPVVLYVRGKLPAVDEEAAVAVVGTRKATPYGVKMGTRMGYGITKCGGLVVSGLTAGVDAAGARGALLAGGACIGVLGSAIDDNYGGSLARDVASAGALVSEYPPGAQGRASNFRARNRITAGLSVAAVVVEAPEKSGALLFADEALSQGKEIYVVPANADAVSGAGSNKLMKEGAKPVTEAWDILSEFERLFPEKLADPGAAAAMPQEQESAATPPPQAKEAGDEPETGKGFAKLRSLSREKVIDKKNNVEYIDLQKLKEGLSESQMAILSAMKEPSMQVDDIIRLSGRSAASVLAELTLLQIRGLVRQESGKRFTSITHQK